MGFLTQRLRMILTLQESTYFKENFINLKKTLLTLNATTSQNLTLKGNFGLALKKCYFKF